MKSDRIRPALLGPPRDEATGDGRSGAAAGRTEVGVAAIRVQDDGGREGGGEGGAGVAPGDAGAGAIGGLPADGAGRGEGAAESKVTLGVLAEGPVCPEGVHRGDEECDKRGRGFGLGN